MKELVKAEGRFAALLTAEWPGRDAYDRPLLVVQDWVLAPTLGAIVPNWLIVVPRRPALSFRGWYDETQRDPVAIVDHVAAHLSLPVERLFWFEHGPKSVGTEVGCGVDYAHLHILLDAPFTIEDFLRHAETSATLNWRHVAAHEAYRRLTGGESYLVVGEGDRAAIAEGVEHTGSQFFRRVVANAVGQADTWNYRCHPHHENITRTINGFRALERAAGRCD
ncbi:MAG: hypothetical protein ACHP7N_02640 [Caulobacterales bacterium]